MNKNKLASEICRTGHDCCPAEVFVQTYCRSFTLVNDILTDLFFAKHLWCHLSQKRLLFCRHLTVWYLCGTVPQLCATGFQRKSSFHTSSFFMRTKPLPARSDGPLTQINSPNEAFHRKSGLVKEGHSQIAVRRRHSRYSHLPTSFLVLLSVCLDADSSCPVRTCLFVSWLAYYRQISVII